MEALEPLLMLLTVAALAYAFAGWGIKVFH